MVNAQKIVIDYLTDTMTVPVYAEVPNPADAEFIVVTVTGGDYDEYTRQQDVAFEIFAFSDTKYKASLLGYNALDKIRLIADDRYEVTQATYGIPYDATDNTKQIKYKFICDLKIKE